MRILYITPTIQDEGGLSRVFSIKANYLYEKEGFEIHFVTLNNDKQPFFDFNPGIRITDLKTGGNKFSRVSQYFKLIASYIKENKPDIIVLCDLGWKGLFFNFFLKVKVPLVYEIHGSLYNEPIKKNWLFKKVRLFIRKTLIKTFSNVVLLTEESKKEWNINCEVIPNPPSFSSEKKSECKNKTALAISRHSYEKGVDRLIEIWAKVHEKFPEWRLKIIGDGYLKNENVSLAKKLNLEQAIIFSEPVKDVLKEYLDCSIYLMTSRNEGYPMVLLEALETGLPIVAYDCPIGPRNFIQNENNGYLIPDGNEKLYIQHLEKLMADESLRIEMGKKASEFSLSKNTDAIMNKWTELFHKLKINE
ncbi:MAG TPA: glycosyltransferase family 4 protein [Flavobacterium sp.]|nr:glycosyltransferase family 4 protein [Flavobacterium sp.]